MAQQLVRVRGLISAAQEVSRHVVQDLEFSVKQLESKLQQHIAELRARNPLYQQIQHLGSGLEQDCSVPPAAWQRSSSIRNTDQGNVSSHEVAGIGDPEHLEHLEQLQTAFVQLQSLQPDPDDQARHGQSLSYVSALFRANSELASWQRLLQLCKLLLQPSTTGGVVCEAAEEQQQLEAELAALATLLSPGKLAVQLKQHKLQSAAGGGSGGGSSSVLPLGFVQHVVAEYASERRQLLLQAKVVSYQDVAAMCRGLYAAAAGSVAGSTVTASCLIGQFDALQLLYKQLAELEDGSRSAGTGGSSQTCPLLLPVSMCLLDAAAAVAPEDAQLLVRMQGSDPALCSGSHLDGTNCIGAASFAYITSSGCATDVVHVFKVASWLPMWTQSLMGLHTTAGSWPADSAPQAGGDRFSGQLAAALALAAACAAAAGCAAEQEEQLVQLAAVRSSADMANEQQHQLSANSKAQREVQAAINRILNNG